ncbi:MULTISPECIES: hypothetical protein [Bacillaceae]|uniref:hypothetical protein n=1 Tax=Bacillaceae TaxID=186817 RepID=UPI0015964CC4|nr:hypothetical protein [Bacillus sp. AFS001701]
MQNPFLFRKKREKKRIGFLILHIHLAVNNCIHYVLTIITKKTAIIIMVAAFLMWLFLI